MEAIDIKTLPPIRTSELVALGDCAVCGGKQLQGGLPLFYRVTLERAGFDVEAVRRAAGLEMALGSLARIMGPDEPIARALHEPKIVFVHEECAGNIGHLLSLMPVGGGE